MLEGHTKSNIEETSIILITDGQENAAPYVAQVLPDILRLGITVDTMLYG